MIGVVLDLVPPRRDQTPRPPRLIRPQKLLLGRRVARALQNDVLVIARPPRANVEPLVLLLIHQLLLGARLADHLPEKLELPLLLLILHRVKQRLVIGRPHHRPHPLHVLLKHLARAQILHVQLVLPEPLVVARIRQQIPIVGDHHRPQRHEGFVLPPARFTSSRISSSPVGPSGVPRLRQ